MNMRVYSISCYSKCGGYFSSYLKELVIVARDENTARKIARKYTANPLNEEFIYEEKLWDVTDLGPVKEGVIKEIVGSDY